ncbi:Protein dip1-like protein [Cladobotryum mycophilum]|uniref:Protein dip1-like protein n=1 Tax=Cladobotryum mycophilum TaxID=491253 RepID=A0ABR0SUD2_9HYPO
MTDIDEAPFSPEDQEQLWAELDHCTSAQCDSHESIDDALRTWLDLTTKLRDRLPDSQEEVLVCAQMLLDSKIYQDNKEYCRTQIIHSLLQEDEAGPLHTIISLLLLDGHQDESTFPRMIIEACFPRLLELISGRQKDDDPRLHRFLLQLMYEMSRIERLKVHDLALVDDDFIHHLLQVIEGGSNDVGDPYHYPTIRVLLVLNEQYMLASTDPVTSPGSVPEPLTNRIVKSLSLHGPLFRTFGENIILLLNRETETSLQLLILKLLYLLFTTKATYEYFYTNDLRVLVDVIIRNLMDLPDERMALRHTYLRILYPLLAHTPLNQPPHYKKDEILRLLRILRGSQNAHFAPADETTLRLVERVAKVKWLEEEEKGVNEEASGQAEVAHKLLGISLSPTLSASSISVGDIAAVKEKPGVQTPSRNNALTSENDTSDRKNSLADEVPKVGEVLRVKKPLPAVPKHRHGVPFTQTATLHVNGVGPVKKVPPKAPPPRRRGKLRVAETASTESIQGAGPE